MEIQIFSNPEFGRIKRWAIQSPCQKGKTKRS